MLDEDGKIKVIGKVQIDSFLPSDVFRYNINETDYHIYKVSKLKKFIERVKFMMQDTLRFLVQDSCQNYVRMITDACSPIMKFKDGEKWPQDDLIHSPYKYRFLVKNRCPQWRKSLLLLDRRKIHYFFWN